MPKRELCTSRVGALKKEGREGRGRGLHNNYSMKERFSKLLDEQYCSLKKGGSQDVSAREPLSTAYSED